MDLLEIIRSRRSIRKYKSQSVEREKIDQILEAGRWAPSGLNNQPWRFMVIEDVSQKDGIARFTKYGNIIHQAPILIAVFLDRKASYHREKDLMAMGACIQNMLLQAHALGLGACWLGEILNRKEEAQEFLKIDLSLELAAVITLGYPNERDVKSSRKSLKELRISGL